MRVLGQGLRSKRQVANQGRGGCLMKNKDMGQEDGQEDGLDIFCVFFMEKLPEMAWNGAGKFFSGQSRPCRHFWRHGFG